MKLKNIKKINKNNGKKLSLWARQKFRWRKYHGVVMTIGWQAVNDQLNNQSDKETNFGKISIVKKIV